MDGVTFNRPEAHKIRALTGPSLPDLTLAL